MVGRKRGREGGIGRKGGDTRCFISLKTEIIFYFATGTGDTMNTHTHTHAHALKGYWHI